MAQTKLTQQEIDERKRIARDAEILASLDNNAPLSEEFKTIREKWINGEISDEEYKAAVLNNKK